MENKEKKQKKSFPTLNPYVFPVLLVIFGLWCFWDGWITTDPEMADHKMFNRVLSGIMLPWSVIDFYRVKKYYKKKEDETKTDDS